MTNPAGPLTAGLAGIAGTAGAIAAGVSLPSAGSGGPGPTADFEAFIIWGVAVAVVGVVLWMFGRTRNQGIEDDGITEAR